jgi:hypothetical protein
MSQNSRNNEGGGDSHAFHNSQNNPLLQSLEPSLWNSPLGRRAFLKKTGAASVTSVIFFNSTASDVVASASFPEWIVQGLPVDNTSTSPAAAIGDFGLWDGDEYEIKVSIIATPSNGLGNSVSIKAQTSFQQTLSSGGVPLTTAASAFAIEVTGEILNNLTGELGISRQLYTGTTPIYSPSGIYSHSRFVHNFVAHSYTGDASDPAAGDSRIRTAVIAEMYITVTKSSHAASFDGLAVLFRRNIIEDFNGSNWLIQVDSVTGKSYYDVELIVLPFEFTLKSIDYSPV